MLNAPVNVRPLEYFILQDATPSGPHIGGLGDMPIFESVTDYFGKSYSYVGLAPRTWAGEIDVYRLKPGEFILPPGLVYRLCKQPRAQKIKHLFGSFFLRDCP